MKYATFLKKFWDRVNKNSANGCWEWTGAKHTGNYGRVWYNNKAILTHRASWEIHNGEIPNNILVCHKCDNPPCVNPDHLFLGSIKDNRQDYVNKGFYNRRTHCIKGHQYTNESIYWYTSNKETRRICKICRDINFKKYQDKQSIF